MKQKKLKLDSKILMILLKFLAHIEDPIQRESFWKKIQIIFQGKNEKFAIFLRYFESNWLPLHCSISKIKCRKMVENEQCL